MRIGEEAVKTHSQGYNCAQCVLAACGDYTGLDRETSMAVAAGFGGGVRSGEICGAISGGVMAIGLNSKEKDLDSAEVSELTKNFVKDFKEKYGCVRCAELKGNGISCDEFIDYGAELAEKIMKEK